MANDRYIYDKEAPESIRVPANEDPEERRRRYKEDREEAARLSRLAKEEMRHVRALRRNLKPHEEDYIHDANTLVEFEVIEGGAEAADEAKEGAGNEGEKEPWERTSTASIDDIERSIDSMKFSPERSTVIDKYEKRFGEGIGHIDSGRGYEWGREMRDLSSERPPWMDARSAPEAPPQRPQQGAPGALQRPVREETFGKKQADQKPKKPWYSMKKLLLIDAVSPKSKAVKAVLIIPDLFIWTCLIPLRIVVIVAKKAAGGRKKKDALPPPPPPRKK